MLTLARIKAAAPKARAYRLTDARGLHLFVAPTGLKSWRLRYREQGREQLAVLGRWPEMSLAEARAAAEERRAARSMPEDAARSFESYAREWIELMLPHWSPRHASDVIRSFERDVFPAIGALPAAEIAPAMVLRLLRAVEARGAIETARRLRERLSCVYALAMTHEPMIRDPAEAPRRVLAPRGIEGRQRALTRPEDLRVLLAALDAVAAPAGERAAARFLALTAQRTAAVLGARWDEFAGLGGPAPLWRIPSARMKLRRVKKGCEDYDHLVPLSAQAAAVIAARPRGGELVFGSLADDALRVVHRRAGYAGRHVPHGWRAAFSTAMNEAAPELGAIVEQVLAHVKGDKVAAAYDRAEHLERRRALLQRWADTIAP